MDCDESNSGLYRMLGLHKAPLSIMEMVGGKKGIKERLSPKYAPGSQAGTNVLARDRISLKEIPAANIAERDGIRLVSTGKIVESMEGCACPIGMLGREFLSKLELSDNEVVLVDMEAGIEHFGRGVETSVDAILAAVEPSMESILLASKIMHLANSMGIKNCHAVLTKVNSEALQATLSRELAKSGVPVAGAIPYDAEIFEACLEGHPLGKGKALEAAVSIVDILLR
ncbi:hypothetical protein ACFLXC_00440 [Chloroflexota bacterium]